MHVSIPYNINYRLWGRKTNKKPPANQNPNLKSKISSILQVISDTPWPRCSALFRNRIKLLSFQILTSGSRYLVILENQIPLRSPNQWCSEFSSSYIFIFKSVARCRNSVIVRSCDQFLTNIVINLTLNKAVFHLLCVVFTLVNPLQKAIFFVKETLFVLWI